MISDELYEILKKWLIEATSGNPSCWVRERGLCSYVGNGDLVEEMQAFWADQGLDTSYPFEDGSVFDRYNSYDADYAKHLNPLRLAWVRERIAEYDHTLAIYEEEKRT